MMRFASTFALIFGAVSADVKISQVEDDGGSDIGGLGTFTFLYWHTWDDASPNEITFNETISCILIMTVLVYFYFCGGFKFFY